MRINDLVVEGKQSVSEIVKRFGTFFQIDAVNSYRSNDGLKINDDDFMQSYELLEPYASDDNLKYYKSLYALHYASETQKFDREYIGDAILVLAHKMITDGSEYKKEILDAITSVNSGLFDCEYEDNLFNAMDLTAIIEELKTMARAENSSSFCSRIGSIFTKRDRTSAKCISSKTTSKNVDNLSDKQIAYYRGAATQTAMDKLIISTGIKEVSFQKSNKLCGLSVLNDNRDLAITKAGVILLDAYDSGAEVLVIEDINGFAMFRKYFSTIEKKTGREMKDLELVSAKDFINYMTAKVA
jgi:hypothetical protein